jgi:hypothetical protein
MKTARLPSQNIPVFDSRFCDRRTNSILYFTIMGKKLKCLSHACLKSIDFNNIMVSYPDYSIKLSP